MDRVFNGFSMGLFQKALFRRQNLANLFPLTLLFREGRSLLRGGFQMGEARSGLGAKWAKLALDWVPNGLSSLWTGFQILRFSPYFSALPNFTPAQTPDTH